MQSFLPAQDEVDPTLMMPMPMPEMDGMEAPDAEFDLTAIDMQSLHRQYPQRLIVNAPSDPELARIFALMEAGGDEDILTDEEREQVNALIQVPNLEEFDRNLAQDMDEGDLDFIAQQVVDRFDWDEQSRKEWYEREAEGIRLLGVSTNVEGGADFEGAADVVHPMMTEAVLQFHARALSEMWPPGGPAKTVVMGEITQDREQQARRVEEYINYAYTVRMKDAFSITDKLLFRLPLSGSVFTKLYYCPLRQQVIRQLIKPGDFVVPYHCDDLDSAPRTTHVLRMTHLDIKKLQAAGFYQQIDLDFPSDEDAQTDRTLRNEIDSTDSRFQAYSDDDDQRHVILEQSCFLNLPGIDPEEGLESPYIVHVEKESQKVLAIYRNWKEADDQQRNPRRYVVHYQFLPGLGFYGLGLYHIMSGLSRSATGALRALLDAAYFANLPAGFRSRDARIRGKDTVLQPGEWKEVEATQEELGKSFFALPYKEPSAVLFNLLGLLDQLGRRLGGAVEVLVGDANTNGPVGTTLALIEQGLKVMSGIHMRLHRAQAEELTLFAELSGEYMPPEGYPYAIPGGDQMIFATDFDARVDVIPVSDPNIVSATHRIALAQAALDLARQAPDLFDLRAVHRRMLTAMRIENPDELMPPEQEPPRADPVTESQMIMTGKPVKAFLDQDHNAHIQVHAAFIQKLPMLDVAGSKGSSKRTEIEQSFMAHIAEHLAMHTRIQFDALLAASGVQIPQQEVPPEIENQIASAAAIAAQSLQPSPGPDPAAVEAERKALLEEERARADIRRKDGLAAADVQRKNAALASELNRKAATQEADLLQKFISTQAEQVLKRNPDQGLPPMNG